MSTGNRLDDYLLKEYDSAQQLTYHIDELRNKLTSFFVAFGGLAAGVLTAVANGAGDGGPLLSLGGVALLLVLISTLAFIIVLILARLRSVQLEHFRIVNNIRGHFIGNDSGLKAVVELNGSTLPSVRRSSGTYYWLLLIMVLGGYALAAALFVALEALAVPGAWRLVVAIVVFGASLFFMDRLYVGVAQPPPAPASRGESEACSASGNAEGQ